MQHDVLKLDHRTFVPVLQVGPNRAGHVRRTRGGMPEGPRGCELRGRRTGPQAGLGRASCIGDRVSVRMPVRVSARLAVHVPVRIAIQVSARVPLWMSVPMACRKSERTLHECLADVPRTPRVRPAKRERTSRITRAYVPHTRAYVPYLSRVDPVSGREKRAPRRTPRRTCSPHPPGSARRGRTSGLVRRVCWPDPSARPDALGISVRTPPEIFFSRPPQPAVPATARRSPRRDPLLHLPRLLAAAPCVAELRPARP